MRIEEITYPLNTYKPIALAKGTMNKLPGDESTRPIKELLLPSTLPTLASDTAACSKALAGGDASKVTDVTSAFVAVTAPEAADTAVPAAPSPPAAAVAAAATAAVLEVAVVREETMAA